MNKYQNIDFIIRQIGGLELLTQLAEEAAELGHAALKLRRVLDGKNPTPVTEVEALEKIEEEIADVQLLVEMVDLWIGRIRLHKTGERIERKVARWVERLKAAKGATE